MKTEIAESITRDWDLVFAESEYIVMQEFIKLLKKGNVKELEYAMELYLDDIKKQEERELLYNLRDLMQTILLWNYSETYRSSDNAVKISNYKHEINMAIDFEGCLSNETLKISWSKTFQEARERAAIFENKIINFKELEWDEVFNNTYSLFHV